jgi:hypothetical protein
MKKKTKKGCLIGLSIFCGFLCFIFILNWGIWRSTAYSLTGIEFPLKLIYETDTSNCGRDLGFVATVYQLPDDIEKLITKQNINLQAYPMFCGLFFDKYTRYKWHSKFPTDEVEQQVYSTFKTPEDLGHIVKAGQVTKNSEAMLLAGYLLKQPGTLCGGWYKIRGKVENDLWIPDYFFYIMNLKHKVLIKFILDT